MQCHCWIGSLCYTAEQLSSAIRFPTNVIAVEDVITILEDLGNKIPDKSWMLYLLELFDGQNKIPIELNLICEFNNKNNFWAIFKGVNRYKFTKVLPSVGHSYLRQIFMNKSSNLIEYCITDIEEKNTERYYFKTDDSQGLCYKGSAHFTGVEWWNKVGNSPFSIRYKIEISDLKFSQVDSGQVIYRPFDSLLPNKGGYALEYPISFDGPSVKDNGCICYRLTPGTSNAGLKFFV